MIDFNKCLAVVLQMEGGYVNNPHDPGGATKMGITHGVLSRHLGHEASVEDILNLSEEMAAEIYRANYWVPVHGDSLPSGLDLCVFDAAVNMGPHVSIKMLQQALKVEADGAWGPHTEGAARMAALDVPSTVRDLVELRRVCYRTMPGFGFFGRGWLRRCDNIEKVARSWATN